ncbi:hypothetical protein FQA39_LY08460 [Lamprigera yunnana]|nr:hypothetical protein FQA39_LY08460 [Lamprigera yunnana]
MEEELSTSEFARLNRAQRDQYLKHLLGEYDKESEFEDDWLPGEALVEDSPSDMGRVKWGRFIQGAPSYTKFICC